jgi:uncharacterized OsmC-like protein
MRNKATAKLIENVSSEVDNSRSHKIVCDLPLSKGGKDSGPTAYELAIMSLADCAVTIFADVAKKSKIEINNLEVSAEVEKPEDSPKPKKAKLKIDVSAKARKGLIEAAWRRTEARCPVVAIFQQSIPIEIELTINSSQ